MAAMLVVGLIPAGYMPRFGPGDTASDSQYLTMVICTAGGAETITINADGMQVDDTGDPQEQPDHDQHATPCAFALASLALTPTSSPALPVMDHDHGDPIAFSEQAIPSRPELQTHPRAPPLA